MKMYRVDSQQGMEIYYSMDSENIPQEVRDKGEIVTAFKIGKETYFDVNEASRAVVKLWLDSCAIDPDEPGDTLQENLSQFYTNDDRIDPDFRKKATNLDWFPSMDDLREMLRNSNSLKRNPNNLVYLASTYSAMGEGSTTWILIAQRDHLPDKMFEQQFGGFAAQGMVEYDPGEFFERFENYLPAMVRKAATENIHAGAYYFATEFHVNFS